VQAECWSTAGPTSVFTDSVRKVYVDVGYADASFAVVAALKSAGVSNVQASMDPSSVLPVPVLAVTVGSAPDDTSVVAGVEVLVDVADDVSDGADAFGELPPHPANASDPTISSADS
jgi:hypothetical protein